MLFKNWLEEISLNRGFIGLQPKWFFQKWDSRAQMFTHAFVLAEGELIWSLNQIKKKTVLLLYKNHNGIPQCGEYPSLKYNHE